MLVSASHSPSHTARAAEADKHAKYKPYTGTDPCATFMPWLGVEMFGRLGPAAEKFLGMLWEHSGLASPSRTKPC